MGLVIFWFILVIVAIVGVVISTANQRVVKNYRAINEQVRDNLNRKKFKSDKEFHIEDCVTLNMSNNADYQRIFVNTKDRKVALVDYRNGKLIVVDYNEIIGAEIYENSAVSSDNLGWGSSKNLHVKEQCNDMKLLIKLDDINNPQVAYNVVFGNHSVDRNSEDYIILCNKLQGIKAFFDVIKNEKTTRKKRFIYCKYCGAKNHEESLKCESCGGELN